MTSMNVYNNNIDLSNADDKKLFLKATTPDSDDIKYDLSTAKFHLFLAVFKEKVNLFALRRHKLLTVRLVDPDGAPIEKTLFRCYGEISLNDVVNQAVTVWYDRKDAANPKILEN